VFPLAARGPWQLLLQPLKDVMPQIHRSTYRYPEDGYSGSPHPQGLADGKDAMTAARDHEPASPDGNG
jgi:hypothetical protein